MHGNASLAFKKIMSKYGLYIVGDVKISLRIKFSAIFNANVAVRASLYDDKKDGIFNTTLKKPENSRKVKTIKN